MLTLSIMAISIFYGVSVLFIILVAFSTPKQSLLDKASEEGDWLYSNFLTKLYTALLGDRDPVPICKSLGLKYDTFMMNCAIIRYMPNYRREAMLRIVGAFLFIIGILLSAVFINILPMSAGIMAYIICASYLSSKVTQQANTKKATMVIEMSRFVDLLLSALEVGMPVEIAIQQTADNVPCILSDELKASFVEVSIGAKNWQGALEGIARLYEVDQLSDFVLDIITAYNKGVSVTDAVARKAYEIKQAALLLAKERTAKMSSIVLLPVVLFKIIPLMALLLAPVVYQIMTML